MEIALPAPRFVPKLLTFLLFPFVFMLLDCASLLSQTSAPGPEGGGKIYAARCASCHDSSSTARIPSRNTLQGMSPERIFAAMQNGVMQSQAGGLTEEQKLAIAGFLTGKIASLDSLEVPADLAASACRTNGPLDQNEPGWNGWSPDLENSRFAPAKTAQLTSAQVPLLRLKWAFAFPGETIARAQPSVFGGRLFVGSAKGVIYSLDRHTGCVYWSFKAEAGVRTAAVAGRTGKRQWAVFFGDARGNVYALDARHGTLLWKVRADPQPHAHITGSPRFYAGRLYVPLSSSEEGIGADPSYPCCKFRGSIVALDALTGRKIWLTHTIPQQPHPTRINAQGIQLWGPSGAPVWSTVTLDLFRKRLYVATGNNYSDPATETSDAILALELDSGKLLWSSQITSGDAYNIACDEGENKTNCPVAKGPDFDFGSPPILVGLASGERLLIASQKSGLVTAIDPDRGGKIRWQTRVSKGGDLGGIQWGSASDTERIYAAISDIVSKEVRIDDKTVTMSLDPQVGGGIVALDIARGEIAWRVRPDPLVCAGNPRCSPAQSAPVTAIPGVVFSGAVDGHLRAYAAADGHVLWETNTAQPFETVNQVRGAHGGSIDAAGPVIVGGTLYMVSGYDTWGGMPGNVLLAFEVPRN
jgi:polyvinyl alcohol dehydrogenase (cytochrome)